MSAATGLEQGFSRTEQSPAGRIGPNAIIQLIEPLRTDYDDGFCQHVFAQAGLAEFLRNPATDMVPEWTVSALFKVIRAELSAEQADKLLAQGGFGTAHYVMRHRIPALVRGLLKFLPATLSGPLLLKAISRNAWTFAGSGQFIARTGGVHQVSIGNNPIATPGCPWHRAVFTTLFREMVSPHTQVRHTQCLGQGDTLCVFEIDPKPVQA